MTEFLQRTPLLQYTLGLVEMSCYRHRDPAGGVLVIPQVIARTAEVTRAVVHIDLHGGDKGDVTVTAEVPDDSQPARAHPAHHLSEAEFYELLGDTTSPNAVRRFQAFVEGLVTAHETLEVTCTPRQLQIRVQPPGRDDSQFTVLSVATSGHVRTRKGWIDFLAENHPTALESFLDGLSSIDPRLRPLKKSGVFSVPKAKSTTCDLVSIMPKLDELAQVVAKAVHATEAGSPE